MTQPLRWLVRNKLHVAACSLAATWAWGRMMGTPALWVDLFVVPALVLSIYQWNRLTDVREDAVNCPDELAAAEQARGLIRVSCLLGVLFALAGALLVGRAAGVLVVLIGLLLGWLMDSARERDRWPERAVRHEEREQCLRLDARDRALPWPSLRCWPRSAILARRLHVPGVWTLEVLWDLRDVRGDTVAGVPSLPVVLGAPAARRLATRAIC